MIKKASRLNTLNRNKYRDANAGNTPIPDVPGSPTGVSAVDVGLNMPFNNGAAIVSFTPAVVGGAATSYTVTSNPGSYTASGSSSPITITGLSSNISYTYTVTSSNSTGSSAPSAPSNSVLATTVPDAPDLFSYDASPPTATVAPGQAYGPVKVSVQFVPPSNSGGSPIQLYTITSYNVTNHSATGTSSPIVITENPGSENTYGVTATNANGTSTANKNQGVSPAVYIQAVCAPSAPVLGTVTINSFTSVNIPYTAASPNGSSITGYSVVSSPSIALTVTQYSTYFTVTGAFAAGTSYTFTVSATNAEGTTTSAASNAVIPLPSVNDNFNRSTSGSLGTSSSGTLWQAIKGTWFANNGTAVTNDSPGNDSIAAVDLGSPLVTVEATTVSLGSGIAFMIQDSNNWWAAVGEETDGYTYAYNYPYTASGTGAHYTAPYTAGPFNGSGTGYGLIGYATTNGTNYYARYGSYTYSYQYYVSGGGTSYYYYSYTAYENPAPVSTSYTQYYLNLYRSVAGTVSTIASTAVSSIINSLKVVVHGSNATATGYSDGAFNSSLGTASSGTITPTGNLHGIILTPSTQNQGNSIGPFYATVTN